MCKDAIFYSATTLWSYWDNRVTSNSLNVDFYTYQTNEQLRLQTPKIKFVIYSQSTSSSSVCMTNSELYRYIYNLKSIITDKLNVYLKEIANDKKYTNGFTHTTSRLNLYTTFMYNELLDSACIRIMIGEKEQSVLESDKIYIPIVEYLSFFLTLNKAFDNYCLMSQNVTILDYLKKLDEKNSDNVNHICTEINNSFKNFTVNVPTTEVRHEIKELEVSVEDLEKESEKDLSTKDTENSEFDKFLNDKYDSIELDLPKETQDNSDKTQKEIVQENFFQKKILKDNFKNLELIITNCVNSRIPLDAFINTIYTTSGIDMYKGISNTDKYALNYILSQDIKYNINNYLHNKSRLSNGIQPIIVDNNDKSNIQDRIDCAYFLLMTSVYLTRIKMDLKDVLDEKINKNLLTYCFKTITSPFVLTYILDINKDILTESIVRLYSNLRSQKFFDEFENEIYSNTKIKIDVTIQYIKDTIDRIYETANKYRDKLRIENFFNSKYMLLTYKDIQNIETEYKPDIINRLLLIEGYYWNNNIDKCYKDVLKSTEGLPVDILNKFGINKSKFNNDILVKYIKTKYPDFKDLEQIKNINLNIYDILDNIDIKNYPLDVLRGLYFWNIEYLPRDITYDGFVNYINNSNLEHSELISLIYDNRYKRDDTFYNALLI